VISYLAGPVSVAALRRTAPELKRPLRTPALQVTAGAAFILATLLLYWARWPLTGEVLLLILIAAPLYIWAEVRAGWRDFGDHLRAALWLVVYLPTLALASFLGSPQFGGIGVIPFGPRGGGADRPGLLRLGRTLRLAHPGAGAAPHRPGRGRGAGLSAGTSDVKRAGRVMDAPRFRLDQRLSGWTKRPCPYGRRIRAVGVASKRDRRPR
jgi:hypothetical protein